MDRRRFMHPGPLVHHEHPVVIRSASALWVAVGLLAAACGGDPEQEPGRDSGFKQAPTANASVTLIAQGELTLAGGRSPDLVIDVPDDTVSVTVGVVGKPAERYRICRWIGPDGALVDEGWEQNTANTSSECKTCALYVREHQQVFAIVAPNNPAATVRPGRHTLNVCGQVNLGLSSAKVNVAVHAKRLPQLPLTGTLDLNLHFTGASGLGAKQAGSDPVLKAALQELAQIVGQVGLTIGKVSWSDVDSRHRVVKIGHITEDTYANVFELFAEAGHENALGVDMFFIERFDPPGLYLAWSGGIPGPPLAHGAAGSGIAVALPLPADCKLTLGRVLAHELGHFLGLCHTDEAVDWLADPLPDTPDADPSYLMHFNPRGTRLSPWQGRILRSSPWVHH